MERNPSRRNFIGSRYRVIKQIAEKCSQVSIRKKVNGVIFNCNFKSDTFCVAGGLITKQCCVEQVIITDSNGGCQLFGVYECLDILVKFGISFLLKADDSGCRGSVSVGQCPVKSVRCYIPQDFALFAAEVLIAADQSCVYCCSCRVHKPEII